jgi:multidrug transporter EmrE-like cation transporter
MGNLGVYLLIIVFTGITVLGDTYLKKSLEVEFPRNLIFIAITVLSYIANMYVFYQAYKHLNMSSVGTVYAIFTILFSVISGVIFFKEHLSLTEYIGIGSAMLSITLLTKFAG